MTIAVLFVCLGNICRSPTAEGVFRHKLQEKTWREQVRVDSAGTSDWHIGSPPDERTQSAAQQRGYDLSALRGRQAIAEDFQRFNFVLAMDENNLQALHEIMPSDFKGHLSLFLDFASESPTREVPDPYYGGERGFEEVLDLVEQASDGLLERIEAQLSRI